ncbi:MAG: hypothetical protein JJT76_19600 [Clostridiaceae bacterium]|nr:hypothetical protein [Clostridiaceae bacterium]
MERVYLRYDRKNKVLGVPYAVKTPTKAVEIYEELIDSLFEISDVE